MSRALALKYRPQTFDEVIGQGITATILKKICEKRDFKNCYLFAGHSGCGKTTLARIFAKAINNGVGEPIEIDGASNNGVDNVRAIIDSANERSLTGMYKIYIIDECHAITTQGWQAFLKGIEEPPAYTIFIFCTTDPDKIPATILNRVQRYNINPISSEDIKNRLLYICQREGFTNYENACDLISKVCNNGMRDAITLLDQCADYSTDLSLENTQAIIGDVSYETMFNLTVAILNKDEASVFVILENKAKSGANLKAFIDQYLTFCLDLSKYCLFGSTTVTNIPNYLESRCSGFSKIPNAVQYSNKIADSLLDLKTLIKYDTSYKTTIETYFVRLIRGE